MLYKTCIICFDDSNAFYKCKKCNFEICMKCYNNIINISENNEYEFKCTQCRFKQNINIKNINKKIIHSMLLKTYKNYKSVCDDLITYSNIIQNLEEELNNLQKII